MQIIGALFYGLHYIWLPFFLFFLAESIWLSHLGLFPPLIFLNRTVRPLFYFIIFFLKTMECDAQVMHSVIKETHLS
jgi:hypothetical protein